MKIAVTFGRSNCAGFIYAFYVRPLIPVITLVGLQAGALIGGAVILEQIFVIPGMGLLLLEAVSSRDYPTITGVFLIFGSAIVFINLLVDLSYGFLDPKVRDR
ncbi:ABC transporter permease subunit [Bradyrhizobium sp. CB2312]|uniref:ABC transporter permease subunit n=1 Tax=Bradyrhizobium sp. CB2312 TaxID=3039155 RepID=UPI0024B0FA43|nr:ABC transporter permease subunit [Bradyrhizobium sp. CB2312]WFU71260.1 ABC transporter permease subunit [Bradyrhizobium sp. CB2312]